MPISIVCTGCEKTLKVPDNVAGKKVRCPSCKAVVEVPAADDIIEPDEDVAVSEKPVAPRKPAKAPPPPPEEDDEQDTAVTKTPPKRKAPRADEEEENEDDGGYGVGKHEDDDDEDDDDRPRRKKKKKRYERLDEYDDRRRLRSRQPHRGVTILVLGIVSILIACLCPLVCWILASITLNMATADKQQMDNGVMDESGHGLTTAGQICAYVGVLLGAINCMAGIALRVGNKI